MLYKKNFEKLNSEKIYKKVKNRIKLEKNKKEKLERLAIIC